LLALINDILDFSKIEAGRLDLEQTDFALRAAIGDTLDTLSLRAHQKGLEVAYHVAPEVPDALIGDPSRLRQIVMNLVGNAIKFTERGEVLVDVSVEKSVDDSIELHIAVKDTGIGIPLEKQADVFAPFTQADSSTTRRYGGTGLGLTISTRLVHLMGGCIWLESEPGIGSTFHFTARFDRGIGSAVPQPFAEQAKLRGLRVLVVDDNETNRRILDEALKHWDMIPVCVDGGPAAVDALDIAEETASPFDLVLLDAQMPIMDGFDLAEKIRARPGVTGVTILMLTSGGQPGDAARCKELGFAAYLTKPVKQADLWRALVRALDGGPTLEPARLQSRRSLPPRALRILLAEDNPMNQLLAIRLLEKQGHAVTVARNGREAIDKLYQFDPPTFDVVLMDVQMPEMDGLAATKAIRDRERGANCRIPIVAMTAHALKGDQERCLAAGMYAYISKPIKPDLLFSTLAEVTPAIAHSLTHSALKEIVDWKAALSHVRGDRELLRELAGIFLAEWPAWIAGLRSEMARGNLEQTRMIAHTVKGSLGTFAATAAHAAAEAVETESRHQRIQSAKQSLEQLEHEMANLLPALETFVRDEI